tara:strand:- start:199 stop:579 length:381 start_codon:yes stop_codon:yes gene_type:complete
LNWSKIAEKALNIYYESFVENRDHCIAQKIAEKFIKVSAIKAGFEFKNLSSNTMPRKELIIIFKQFAERMRYLEKEKKIKDNGEFLWPLHSWLSNHCYKNLQIHGKNEFKIIQKYIDEELTQYLPD